MPEVRALWTPRAFLPAGWGENVLLRIGDDGRWSEVKTGVETPPDGASVLAAPLLPSLVDAHGHAFQRAFAGLAERRDAESDDFWSWRDRMYRVALRITPDELGAIAAQLYLELLRGGYTQVCEFHYLQHDRDGKPYSDPHAMSWALADAAEEAGIGLTLLPVLYERAGFADPRLRGDQRRFSLSAEGAWRAQDAMATSGRKLVNAGIAIHSLRAAAPRSIAALMSFANSFDGPIHIHVAEQPAEVEDCIAATGRRPIEWLCREGLLDRRWQLVHATHATTEEIAEVARSGAGLVLCPTTEANLGDGLPDLPAWLDAGVPLAIGSDSHVTRDWREELRMLDYGQRLVRRRRNVGAAPQHRRPSTAENLFAAAVKGGPAAGERAWGLVAGARADALAVNVRDEALSGIPTGNLLDALVFSSPGRPWRDVLVAGHWVIRDGAHPQESAIARRFADAMRSLWADGSPPIA
jgi:formimidoylglutamate deiminase